MQPKQMHNRTRNSRIPLILPLFMVVANAALFAQAGLNGTQVSTLTVSVRHASFGDWWEPFTLGVGPAGAYVASLTPDRRAALRDQCRELLPAGPVEISASAWAAVSRA